MSSNYGWGNDPVNMTGQQMEEIIKRQMAASGRSNPVPAPVVQTSGGGSGGGNNFGVTKGPTSGSGDNFFMDNTKLIKRVGFGLLALILVLGTFKIVPPGSRGIRVTMGHASLNTLDEGIHFKLPLISTIHLMSIQVQKTEEVSEAATKDLQKISAKFALNWNLNPENVVDVYRNIGTQDEIAERIIQPAVSEVLKAATAKMTAEEVLLKRLELKQNIDDMLVKRLANYNVIVKDVSLVNLDFTGEFNRAVEAKQIAEQDAKKAEYVAIQATNEAKGTVNKAKGTAEAVLINARAQAEAQKLLQQSTNSAILQLKAIEKWDGEMPQFMGSGGNMLFNIPTKGNGEGK
jgi:prohibitin 1